MTEWTVIDDKAGIVTRQYAFRPKALARMMTARAQDGSLVVISPACGLDAAAFRDLQRFGKPSTLIAPNGFHHLGLPEWKKAFPEARVYAVASAHKRLEKKHEALDIEPLSALGSRLGPDVKVLEVAGHKGETWLIAKASRGAVWYVSDSFFSNRELPPGVIGLIFKLTRSGPGFRPNGFGRFFIKDKAAHKRFILDLLSESPPAVIVTAHGDVVDQPNLSDTVRTLADQF